MSEETKHVVGYCGTCTSRMRTSVYVYFTYNKRAKNARTGCDSDWERTVVDLFAGEEYVD